MNSTWRELLDSSAADLKEGGSENPRQEARWILNHVATRAVSFPIEPLEGPVTAQDQQRAAILTRRRRSGEPLQIVLEQWDFHGHTFEVRRGVLVPRPETESLVDLILTENDSRPRTVLDLGCGSGVIGISLKRARPSWTIFATDLDPEALDLTGRNARALGVSIELVRHDMTTPFARVRSMDLVVSNPPYIPSLELPTLPPEVTNYDPQLALDGGADGLDGIRHVLDQAIQLLPSGGRVYFEMGSDQRKPARILMRARGLHSIRCVQDLSGRDRIMVGIRGSIP